jgi:hypothetical protein
MEEHPTCFFTSSIGGANVSFWCFPDASHSYRSCAFLPIPFFLACLCASFDGETIDTCSDIQINMWHRWWVQKRKKRGQKSSWSGNMEVAQLAKFSPINWGENFVRCFPMPTIPIVFKQSFLFLFDLRSCFSMETKCTCAHIRCKI